MFYLPLPALALLLLSGLYLYVVPHLGSRRRATANTGSRGPQVRPAGTRALHRWAAAAFVLSIVVVSVTLAVQGPMWVSYLPLLPLVVLLVTGLVMFVRPKVSRRKRHRGGRCQGPAVGDHPFVCLGVDLIRRTCCVARRTRRRPTRLRPSPRTISAPRVQAHIPTDGMSRRYTLSNNQIWLSSCCPQQRRPRSATTRTPRQTRRGPSERLAVGRSGRAASVGSETDATSRRDRADAGDDPGDHCRTGQVLG